jgi:hypothetical protein
MTKKVDVLITSQTEDGGEVETLKTFDYAELALDTSIEMRGLEITDSRTNQDGEVTLYCMADGVKLQIFLSLMYDDAGNPVQASEFEGKTINVKGIVDKFYDHYQIRVLTYGDIGIQ